MAITHEQAQKLIQLNLDQMLSREELARLSAHLRGCGECMLYASEIKEVAEMLPPLLNRRWNIQPVPLSIGALVEKNENSQPKPLLTMRTAAVSLTVMALFFSAWQFVLSSQSPPSRVFSAIPPVPTPSSPTLQLISTQLTLEGCAIISYTVQEQDTLSSLAEQFSVPEPAITELNQIEAEAVQEGVELMIPLCHFTPTGTFHAATFTTTLTPVLNFRTSTPGG
jgi:hypothetical protein